MRTRRTAVGLAVLSLVPILAGCPAASAPEATRLRVLASPELADMQPLLDDLRKETGIELVMEYRPGVDTSPVPWSGQPYDFAWLASGAYRELTFRGPAAASPRPLSTPIMLSPIVVGVSAAAAARLRTTAVDAPLTWADIADGAAAGTLKLAMADPKLSGSGLVALVGVATAAAGTGSALRAEDVACDRLRGFFSGQAANAPTSTELTDEFVRRQDSLDALIGEESALLSLNDSGKLRQKLEIIYPFDGIVQAEHPLVLVNPAQRSAYDDVVAWLKSRQVQQRISERTLRRPVNPDATRDPRLRESVGAALYFPDQLAIVDKLLAHYADQTRRGPSQVIFVLDFSGSMRGSRIAALRASFAGLSGADRSGSGKFFRFYQGETFTVIRFGGGVLAERDFTANNNDDLDALRDFIAADDFDEYTAVWSALDHAYRKADTISPDRPVAVVLMTDGESNAGITLDEFIRRHPTPPMQSSAVHTFTIRYGEADPAQLDRAARATGGRMVDANASSLVDAFKEIRGCE